MAAMNPIVRLRRAFHSLGVEEAQADEAADAIDNHTYGRRESDLKFKLLMTEMRRDMAEMRTQLLLAMMIATGLIIGAVGLLIAFLD